MIVSVPDVSLFELKVSNFNDFSFQHTVKLCTMS